MIEHKSTESSQPKTLIIDAFKLTPKVSLTCNSYCIWPSSQLVAVVTRRLRRQMVAEEVFRLTDDKSVV